LRIHGKVQGVFYRASTLARARSLGLSGIVRNEADGSVTCIAEGPRRQLETLLTWCRVGPSGAEVDRVDATWDSATGEYEHFSIDR
jgi:acylphosphatase